MIAIVYAILRVILINYVQVQYFRILTNSFMGLQLNLSSWNATGIMSSASYYGRPWPAVYINFVLKIHQIHVLTEPLCRAQARFMRCRTTSGVPNIVG